MHFGTLRDAFPWFPYLKILQSHFIWRRTLGFTLFYAIKSYKQDYFFLLQLHEDIIWFPFLPIFWSRNYFLIHLPAHLLTNILCSLRCTCPKISMWVSLILPSVNASFSFRIDKQHLSTIDKGDQIDWKSRSWPICNHRKRNSTWHEYRLLYSTLCRFFPSLRTFPRDLHPSTDICRHSAS